MELPTSVLLTQNNNNQLTAKYTHIGTNLGQEINNLLPDEISSHG
jgi:hypothetical protein